MDAGLDWDVEEADDELGESKSEETGLKPSAFIHEMLH